MDRVSRCTRTFIAESSRQTHDRNRQAALPKTGTVTDCCSGRRDNSASPEQLVSAMEHYRRIPTQHHTPRRVRTDDNRNRGELRDELIVVHYGDSGTLPNCNVPPFVFLRPFSADRRRGCSVQCSSGNFHVHQVSDKCTTALMWSARLLTVFRR